MPNEFCAAEADPACPVSLDTLGQLYRADPAAVAGMVSYLPEDRRARLAMFCYARAHFRELGLTIAASCNETRLAELAGVLGQVLAAQCRAKVRTFGSDLGSRVTARPKISLAGARA